MENGVGADIRVVPHEPVLAPYRGTSTGIDQVEVIIAPLLGTQTGGSPITSYYIQFDDLSNGVDWLELQGFTTQSTALSLIKSGLITNKVYQFRYKAKNIFGWSNWSPVGLIKTITVPDKMAKATTSLLGDNIRIQWVQPFLGGNDLLLAYNVTLRGSDGRLYTQLTYCDGTDALVMRDAECYIPMSVFWAAPFNLLQEDLIQVKVAA